MWLEKTKYEFLFFGLKFLEPYVWPEKSMRFFFLELILFLEPILLLALCLAPKSMNSFFFGTFFFGTHTFFCWNLGTHTFFDVMFGPKKYESCPFPELLVFLFAVIF